PGIAGATETVTLGEDYLPERVVVTHGKDTTEFAYSGFQDFNNPLHRIEALYAGTIVERHNDTVVRELKTKLTEIGQVSVGMAVAASVRKGGPAQPIGGAAQLALAKTLPSVATLNAAGDTPRLADGKPDLTGSWQPGGGGQRGV